MVGGFVYQGSNVTELRGKYLFSDFAPGRVFYTDTREMHSGGKLATIYELALFMDKGQPVTMQQSGGACLSGTLENRNKPGIWIPASWLLGGAWRKSGGPTA